MRPPTGDLEAAIMATVNGLQIGTMDLARDVTHRLQDRRVTGCRPFFCVGRL